MGLRRFVFRMFVITGILVGLVLPQVAMAETVKIGYVDIDYAINHVPEGIKARETMEKEGKEKESILSKQEQDIMKFGEEIKKQSSVLSQDAKYEKVQQYSQKRMDYQKTYTDFQREFQKREYELTKDILADFQKVIEQMGKEGGYTIILEKTASSVLYAQEKIDLTNALIKKYNALPKKK